MLLTRFGPSCFGFAPRSARRTRIRAPHTHRAPSALRRWATFSSATASRFSRHGKRGLFFSMFLLVLPSFSPGCFYPYNERCMEQTTAHSTQRGAFGPRSAPWVLGTHCWGESRTLPVRDEGFPEQTPFLSQAGQSKIGRKAPNKCYLLQAARLLCCCLNSARQGCFNERSTSSTYTSGCGWCTSCLLL